MRIASFHRLPQRFVQVKEREVIRTFAFFHLTTHAEKECGLVQLPSLVSGFWAFFCVSFALLMH